MALAAFSFVKNMAITKAHKKRILDHATQALEGSQSAVFVNFSGLTVAKIDELRSKLYAEGVGYKVLKKTLLKRALESMNYEGEIPALDGEIAFAYSSDLTAPAREVYAFHENNKNNIQIVGGVFEGRYQNKAEMTEIATIPSVPVLRGMFVNVINSPIQGFVVALSRIAEAKEA